MYNRQISLIVRGDYNYNIYLLLCKMLYTRVLYMKVYIVLYETMYNDNKYFYYT